MWKLPWGWRYIDVHYIVYMSQSDHEQIWPTIP